MKIKTSQDTVQTLIDLLERFDACTEQFLDELPTPEKYAILGMALIVRGDDDDFEIACAESMHRVSAQGLTNHLMDFQFLDCHLQDALRRNGHTLKWYGETARTKMMKPENRRSGGGFAGIIALGQITTTKQMKTQAKRALLAKSDRNTEKRRRAEEMEDDHINSVDTLLEHLQSCGPDLTLLTLKGHLVRKLIEYDPCPSAKDSEPSYVSQHGST